MDIGIVVLVIFLAAAILMFFRKLPAMLALPLMAVFIALTEVFTGKLTITDVSIAVVADGSMRLIDPIIISMFGGMLSLLMQKAGVVESIVRKGAELSGDNPIVVALVMMGIISLLFTTIGGLGAVIMVGTIVLPILASIGIREYISAGIVLFGISLGGIFNANNWAIFSSVLRVPTDIVSSFAFSLSGVIAVVAIAFIVIELSRGRSGKLRAHSIVRGSLWTLGVVVTIILLRYAAKMVGGENIMNGFRWLMAALGVFITVLIVKDVFDLRRGVLKTATKWYAYIIPVVPLILILLFNVAFVPAFFCGFVYAIFATLRRGTLNMATRSIIEGSQSVIPAIVLMIGIGMLLSAILGPTHTGPGAIWYEQQRVSIAPPSIDGAVSNGTMPEWPILTDMKPLLRAIVPNSTLGFIVIFSLLGPFALYRGPLNVWGLGYGVGGVLLAMGVPPGAVMGMLMSMGIIQGVSDPTNTQNVWLANEVRLDVNILMWKTLPYTWIVAVLGLIIAGFRFY
jgi:hypothetical protein